MYIDSLMVLAIIYGVLTTQPLAHSKQLPARNNSNKWVIDLSRTPLSQAQASLFAKGPN